MGSLKNPRVLIVEDEAFIALDMERELQEAAYDVVAVGSEQLALLEIESQGFDCAVVDLTLQGEVSLAIVNALSRKGIPYIVVSGCEENVLPPVHRNKPFLSKPYVPAALLGAVRQATSPQLQPDILARRRP